MNWLVFVVPIAIAVAWWLLRQHRRKLSDVSQMTSVWPSEPSSSTGQHEGVTIPMSLTTINPQDDGGSPPPAPTPVQPQAEVKATAYQLFYRDLETYMKHRPHSMFSKAQCLALFNTYERGLVEMQDIRGQLSQNSPASLEDGEV